MTGHSINRRAALQALAMATAGFVAGPLSAAQTSCSTWLAMEANLDAFRALGREYLGIHPGDPNVEAIWMSLGTDEERGVTGLRKRVIDDYSASRLVQLSGWWVSQTEGRLFAAIATHC